MAQLEDLAERRDDDLCDVGPVASEEIERMQLASLSSQEYAQLYASSIARRPPALSSQHSAPREQKPLDDLDAEDLLMAPGWPNYI